MCPSGFTGLLYTGHLSGILYYVQIIMCMIMVLVRKNQQSFNLTTRQCMDGFSGSRCEVDLHGSLYRYLL